jgi:hypothetical protein
MLVYTLTSRSGRENLRNFIFAQLALDERDELRTRHRVQLSTAGCPQSVEIPEHKCDLSFARSVGAQVVLQHVPILGFGPLAVFPPHRQRSSVAPIGEDGPAVSGDGHPFPRQKWGCCPGRSPRSSSPSTISLHDKPMMVSKPRPLYASR